MNGSAEFEIEIDPESRVEGALCVRQGPTALADGCSCWPRRRLPCRRRTIYLRRKDRNMRKVSSSLILVVVMTIAAPVFAVKTSHWRHSTESDFDSGVFERVVATNLGDLKLSRELSNLLGDDARVRAVFAMVQVPMERSMPVAVRKELCSASKTTKSRPPQSLGSTPTFSACWSIPRPAGGGTGERRGRSFASIARAKNRRSFPPMNQSGRWSKPPTARSTPPPDRPDSFFRSMPAAAKRCFDSDESNLLSLISDGGDLLYAGTDPHGLVYRINRKSGEVFVVYDAPESEISALDTKGNLFAGTSPANEAEDDPAGDGSPEQVGRPKRTRSADSMKSPGRRKFPPPRPWDPCRFRGSRSGQSCCCFRKPIPSRVRSGPRNPAPARCRATVARSPRRRNG